MELTNKINSIVQKLELIKKELIAKIGVLPQNKNITPLNNNCFVMSVKHFSLSNWSPEYYDFNNQYQKIIEIIENSELLTIEKKLDGILKDGKIKINNSYTYHFHPDVIDYLKRIF